MAPPKKDHTKSTDLDVDEEAVAAMAAAADTVEGAIGGVVDEVVASSSPTPKKKRLCRFPGCNKVIKSQGHCQRHGAKAKRCKVEGCEKQAQGTHEGMCKRHWKAVHFPAAPFEPKEQPPPPEGESVYDIVLPSSISYRPSGTRGKMPQLDLTDPNLDPLDPPSAPEGVAVMPLVAYLQEGRTKEAGWHRNAERRARGMFPQSSLSSQLEAWERQLALVEILLLSGGTPYANFKDLSHAWGREKGFHNILASSVCERRGEVERKRRSDAGRPPAETERSKLKKAKTNNEEAVEQDMVDEVAKAETGEVDVMQV